MPWKILPQVCFEKITTTRTRLFDVTILELRTNESEKVTTSTVLFVLGRSCKVQPFLSPSIARSVVDTDASAFYRWERDVRGRQVLGQTCSSTWVKILRFAFGLNNFSLFSFFSQADRKIETLMKRIWLIDNVLHFRFHFQRAPDDTESARWVITSNLVFVFARIKRSSMRRKRNIPIRIPAMSPIDFNCEINRERGNHSTLENNASLPVIGRDGDDSPPPIAVPTTRSRNWHFCSCITFDRNKLDIKKEREKTEYRRRYLDDSHQRQEKQTSKLIFCKNSTLIYPHHLDSTVV